MRMTDKYQIVLASGSARRKELLGMIGLDFELCVSDVAEHFSPAHPGTIVEELALRKARAVVPMIIEKEQLKPQKPLLIIGADTIVVADQEILNKPVDAKDAQRMLSKLQGHHHYVYTGVALIIVEAGEIKQTKHFHEATKVFVKAMSTAEMHAYIEQEAPYDKAGSYGIQGAFAQYITRIEGDYFNVVGFPLAHFHEVLKTM